MPDWMADININVGWVVAAIAGAVVLVGAVRMVAKPIKKIMAAFTGFMDGWNGTAEVEDASGAVIKPAVPGVLAQMGVLRQQLENSHQNAATPNLRDDLDTKASKDDVAAVATSVRNLTIVLREHIDIAKKSDDRQDETERIVTKYLPALRQLLED